MYYDYKGIRVTPKTDVDKSLDQFGPQSHESKSYQDRASPPMTLSQAIGRDVLDARVHVG